MHPSLQATFPDRLIPLSTGQPGLRGGLQVEVREPSPHEVQTDAAGRSDDVSRLETGAPASSPILDFIASTGALDRYDEIIEPAGWRLDNYRRNPVFQNAHQYGDVIFTLGRALITEVRGAEAERGASERKALGAYLFQRIEFAVEVNPMAKIAYGLYRGKFLNAVSVGFIPLRWEDDELEGEWVSEKVGEWEKTGKGPGRKIRRRYLEQELLEVSAVGIPANPEALQLALKGGAIQKGDVKDALEWVRQIMATNSGPNTDTKQALVAPESDKSGTRNSGFTFVPRLSTSTGQTQLLRLARTLRDILRQT